MRNFIMTLSLGAALAACTDSQPGEQLQIDEEASAKADGSLWYKLYTCNGNNTLDVNGNERRNVQLVIRDGSVIKFLNDRGVIQSSYGATEAVLSGWTGYVDWGASLGPVLHYQPYGGPGIFNRSDFSRTELIANTNTWCGATAEYCPGDGYPCSTYCSEQHTEFVEKANWYFDSCQ